MASPQVVFTITIPILLVSKLGTTFPNTLLCCSN